MTWLSSPHWSEIDDNNIMCRTRQNEVAYKVNLNPMVAEEPQHRKDFRHGDAPMVIETRGPRRML